jgi:hypothetical protein
LLPKTPLIMLVHVFLPYAARAATAILLVCLVAVYRFR